MRYKTKAEATASGKALLKKMRGTGWKLRVWENLGWHCSISSGPIAVYEDPAARGGYFVLVSNDPKAAGWGATFWNAGYAGRNPNRLVGAATKQVAKVVLRHQAVLRALWKAAGKVEG